MKKKSLRSIFDEVHTKKVAEHIISLNDYKYSSTTSAIRRYNLDEDAHLSGEVISESRNFRIYIKEKNV